MVSILCTVSSHIFVHLGIFIVIFLRQNSQVLISQVLLPISACLIGGGGRGGGGGGVY